MDQKEHSTDHRAALFAGFLGWTLDAFDFFLVVVTLTAIAKEFHRTDKEIALSIALMLGFRPEGAFIFGLLADRYGRRLPLMLDLVFYSVVEVLSIGRASCRERGEISVAAVSFNNNCC